MARRHYWRRRRPETIEDILAPLFGLLSLGIVGYVLTHTAQIITWGIIVLEIGGAVAIAAGAIYVFYRKRKRASSWKLDDEKTLYMLKGMSPAQFEQEMAAMFRGLGYDAEVVGGANDGGIDVIAHKNGKKYYIQCKKFITQQVTPHDVRDFLGAVTNANNPADKGFFITTGGFTEMAKRAAEGNPRIELIDGLGLVEYYKMAHGNGAPEAPAPAPLVGTPAPAVTLVEQHANDCPWCGGHLVLHTAKHGERAGKQFWGCSNFASTGCKFIRDVQEVNA